MACEPVGIRSSRTRKFTVESGFACVRLNHSSTILHDREKPVARPAWGVPVGRRSGVLGPAARSQELAP